MFLGESQENKIFKYLSIGLLVLALLILVKEIFFKPEPLPNFQPATPPSEIKIDFDFLKSQALSQLLSFPKSSLPETFGRPNPFIAY